jgi:hypothetical protein
VIRTFDIGSSLALQVGAEEDSEVGKVRLRLCPFETDTQDVCVGIAATLKPIPRCKTNTFQEMYEGCMGFETCVESVRVP